MMKIPPQKPHFSADSVEFVLENFRAILEGKSFLSMFRHCETFEKEFAQIQGAKYAITCSSGTSAIELALRAMGVSGGEVIVPSNTMAASAFAVLASGNTPVFADAGDDLCVDPDDVERCITPKTKAIMTVHIGGRVSPGTAALVDLCDRKGLPLMEDAAHAHGSKLDGKGAGTFGQAGSFSFFSTKVMTTGEGGMVVTNDEGVREQAAMIRDYAKKDGRNYHEVYGNNWRMSEVQALMGVAQCRELPAFIARRQEIAKLYDEAFGDFEHLQVVDAPSSCFQNFYKYIALLPDGVDRGAVSKKLKEDHTVSLGGPVYEVPLHEQPVFKPYVNRELPRAADVCRRHICPPMFFTMTDEEARYTADCVKKVVHELASQPARA